MNVEDGDSKFTWGDSVIVRKNSPTKFHPGEFASVCGFYKVQSKETAKELACRVGDWVYTIEFGDGSDVQVPEIYLDRDLSIIRGGELSKYGSSFVNGTVSELILDVDLIKIKIESCSVEKKSLDDKFIFKDGFFIGLLTAIQVHGFFVKNSNCSGGQRHAGSILSFEISDHVLKLNIEWEKTRITSLEIQAGQIWWQQECADGY